MLACFALVIIQLANIQFVRAKSLASSPYNPRLANAKKDNLRGNIYASDGTLLATSVKTSTGFYHYMRQYPQGPLYAGITGYDSPYYYGTSGIEYEYNQYLQTHSEAPQNLSQLLFNKPPSEPDDVTLTIDPALQQAADTALTTLPPSVNKDGAVVVLDPTTGAVLAMVSNPTYDPNGLAVPSVTADQTAYAADIVDDQEGFNGLTPIATEQRFPPGSTFKVVTSTAVYNLKPSLVNFNFPVAKCITFDDSNTPLCNDNDTDACGGTMAVMLPQSCDPGYGMLGEKIGVPILTQQAQDFGYAVYGSPHEYVPNIDLPDVIPSTFSYLVPNSQAFLAQSSIGQYNDAATALQNALVAAGIANGGVIMTPHLMQQIRDAQGNVVTTYHPTPMLTASTQSAAASVNALMQNVASGVVPDATASGIFPPAWQMAVKTGTAQIIATPTHPEETTDWMIGFDHAKGVPDIAVAVVIPQQASSFTGAKVAGPIMKAVVGAYLAETGQG